MDAGCDVALVALEPDSARIMKVLWCRRRGVGGALRGAVTERLITVDIAFSTDCDKARGRRAGIGG